MLPPIYVSDVQLARLEVVARCVPVSTAAFTDTDTDTDTTYADADARLHIHTYQNGCIHALVRDGGSGRARET